ncbi:J domain-containing protein [Photobacterium nomapromontoriensis]|uniref:J domain-containing protein n=1 Tax=Photobacterium nomapromontoriensis TaxID=2910237 RepID=UPI003D131B55
MTTFYDILGTDKKTPPADVKRQYKLLSSRCHPDKGGSKSLMQLISQAYEKILSGNGHEEAVQTVFVKSDAASDIWQKKYRQLDADYKALKSENQSLVQQLKDALQNVRKATGNSNDGSRHNQALEDDNQVLKRENRRLQIQLDNARRELNRGGARTVFSADESLSNTEAMASAISPTILKQLRGMGAFNYRKWLLVLMLPVLMLGMLLGLGREPLTALWGMMTSPEKVKTDKVVTILHTNPLDANLANKPRVDKPVVPIPAAPKQQPRISLVASSGVWTLSQFENTGKPYISVRSEKGSYIVKSCKDDFKYYKTMNMRSGRLAANLIFERIERHFEIYNIPYGNGSFAMNWTESKSLLINNEYFPNANFARVYRELQKQCI